MKNIRKIILSEKMVKKKKKIANKILMEYSEIGKRIS